MQLLHFFKLLFTGSGLILSLIGAYKLYRSVISYPQYYQKPGEKESYPMAVLNMNVAKKGISLIIAGTLLQLLAVLFQIL
mgnify:CR=1 FL=1